MQVSNDCRTVVSHHQDLSKLMQLGLQVKQKIEGSLFLGPKPTRYPLIRRAGTGCISHLQARRAHQWRCNWSDRNEAGMNDLWKREKSGCKKRGLKEIDYGGSKFYCNRNYCLTDCDELHVRLQAENVICWVVHEQLRGKSAVDTQHHILHGSLFGWWCFMKTSFTINLTQGPSGRPFHDMAEE